MQMGAETAQPDGLACQRLASLGARAGMHGKLRGQELVEEVRAPGACHNTGSSQLKGPHAPTPQTSTSWGMCFDVPRLLTPVLKVQRALLQHALAV